MHFVARRARGTATRKLGEKVAILSKRVKEEATHYSFDVGRMERATEACVVRQASKSDCAFIFYKLILTFFYFLGRGT
jgi:adenylate cyclase class IV